MRGSTGLSIFNSRRLIQRCHAWCGSVLAKRARTPLYSSSRSPQNIKAAGPLTVFARASAIFGKQRLGRQHRLFPVPQNDHRLDPGLHDALTEEYAAERHFHAVEACVIAQPGRPGEARVDLKDLCPAAHEAELEIGRAIWPQLLGPAYDL